jgi:hypothetical protein
MIMINIIYGVNFTVYILIQGFSLKYNVKFCG